MTVGFSIFVHEPKREKKPKNEHFKKVIKERINLFFKYDPTECIFSMYFILIFLECPLFGLISPLMKGKKCISMKYHLSNVLYRVTFCHQLVMITVKLSL